MPFRITILTVLKLVLDTPAHPVYMYYVAGPAQLTQFRVSGTSYVAACLSYIGKLKIYYFVYLNLFGILCGMSGNIMNDIFLIHSFSQL